MTKPNIPTLDEIAHAADPGALSKLPIDVLAMLVEDAEAAKKRAATVAGLIASALESRFAPAITGAFKAAGKDTGTVRVFDADYDVIADRAKRVDWDQAALAALADKIRQSGEDPADYIKIKYDIEERKYSAWPAGIRAPFEAARTVRPGALSIKLAKKEAA